MAHRGSSKHRPVFHGIVLAIGFVVGGLLTVVAREFLPSGAVKDLLTMSVNPSIGPMQIKLVILTLAIGPIALDVSVISLFGVLVAYLIARSLF